MQHQTIENDHKMLQQSDELSMKQSIQATHAPDGREVDCRAILELIQKSLLTDSRQLEQRILQDEMGISAHTIQRIYHEILCNCLECEDAHVATMSLFSILSGYPWEVKLVLALLALAMNYGEFGLLTHIHSRNPLAEGIAHFKQLPRRSNSLKPRLDALDNLYKGLRQAADDLIEIRYILPTYNSPDDPSKTVGRQVIATVAYWAIRGVVACISQITSLTSLSHSQIPISEAEVVELSELAEKISIARGRLQQLRPSEYTIITRILESVHIDNMKILRALIYAKDGKLSLFKNDQLELLSGSSRNKVGFDVLDGKEFFLLISDLDLSDEQIFLFRHIYDWLKRKSSLYEMLWLAIVDVPTSWNETMQEKYEKLQSSMPWYVVHNPSSLKREDILQIKEKTDFDKLPILVMLDREGRVICRNALHMLWIWGDSAFPLSTERETELWEKETWSLELLLERIDATIINWRKEGDYICLYGGVDIEWIRKFTTTARNVADEAKIPLKMVYVGDSNGPLEQVHKIMETVTTEKLSYCFPDLILIWFFWTRLEHMWHSRMKLGKNVDNDEIMADISKIISLGEIDQGGWALMFTGLIDEGTKKETFTTLICRLEIDQWQERVLEFVTSVTSLATSKPSDDGGDHVHIPSETEMGSGKMVCKECGRPMEKYVMYSCFIDDA